MARRDYQRGPRRLGAVYLAALILLIALTCLGAVLSSSTVLELRKSDNSADTLQARMSAESGLNYMLMKIDEVRMPAETDGDTLIANLTAEFVDVLGRTGDVAAAQITSTATTIWVPEIVVNSVRFSTVFAIEGTGPAGKKCHMTVTGRCGAAKRRVSVSLNRTPRPAEAFEYGIASKGSIFISGSGTVEGANTGQEATVFSMSNQPVAIEAGGKATIGGDLYVTNEDEASILLAGKGLSVAGETDIFTIIKKHAHFGVEPPEFPEIDVAPIASLATGFIDVDTKLPEGDLVLNNIRIKPGTDPVFGSNTTINGVLVIESPNTVIFEAGTVINGIVVCEDDGAEDIVNKQLEFQGHVSAPGVEALPDIPMFEEVKKHVGTVVLAPGYGVTFRGTTNSINGTIAADQFAFLGATDISGELNGMILGLSDREMILEGNATLRINRQTDVETPAGFVHLIGLVVAPGTYTE